MTQPAAQETGYSGTKAAKIVGISYRQLDYWARTGLVRPSLADAKGSGSRREYGYRDLLELRVIKSLLDAGIKLESVRTAFEYLRAHATTFDDMAAVDFGGRPMSYTTGGTSERVFGTLVSASFFDVLGAPMALGRGFRADEDVTPGARPVSGRSVSAPTRPWWAAPCSSTRTTSPWSTSRRRALKAPVWPAPICGCRWRWWPKRADSRMRTC